MRSKRIVLLAVLLALYIVPVNLYHTSTSLAIVAEHNFTLSDGENWLTDWTYRKEVSINGSSSVAGWGAGINYQVLINVTYEAGMQSDFDDLRVTDNDGDTELDYWLEYYVASTYADMWVEVADDLDNDQVIYLYYGNSTVSTTSNGTNTFIFFDDFENNNLNRWDVSEANWATTSAQKKRGSYSAFGDADATGREMYNTFTNELEDDQDFMIHSWIRNPDITGTTFPMYGIDDGADEVYFVGTGEDDFRTYDGTAWRLYDTASAIQDTWIRLELGVDNVFNVFNLFIDRVNATDTWPNSNDQGNPIGDTEQLGTITSTTDGSDQYLDDWYIRKWLHIEPAIDSIGVEEEYVPPQWNLNDTLDIAIFILVDETGLNMFLIICGLVLIPLSSIYLVWGGKNAMSRDKFFYGIILFLMGWGLFLGGILT